MKKLVLAVLLSAMSTSAFSMDMTRLSLDELVTVITDAQDEVVDLQTRIAQLQSRILDANTEISRRDAIEQGPTTESYARDAFEGDTYLMMSKGPVVRYIVETSNNSGDTVIEIRAGSVNGRVISTAQYDNLEVNFSSAYFYLTDRGFSADMEVLSEYM